MTHNNANSLDAVIDVTNANPLNAAIASSEETQDLAKMASITEGTQEDAVEGDAKVEENPPADVTAQKLSPTDNLGDNFARTEESKQENCIPREVLAKLEAAATTLANAEHAQKDADSEIDRLDREREQAQEKRCDTSSNLMAAYWSAGQLIQEFEIELKTQKGKWHIPTARKQAMDLFGTTRYQTAKDVHNKYASEKKALRAGKTTSVQSIRDAAKAARQEVRDAAGNRAPGPQPRKKAEGEQPNPLPPNPVPENELPDTPEQTPITKEEEDAFQIFIMAVGGTARARVVFSQLLEVTSHE